MAGKYKIQECPKCSKKLKRAYIRDGNTYNSSEIFYCDKCETYYKRKVEKLNTKSLPEKVVG